MKALFFLTCSYPEVRLLSYTGTTVNTDCYTATQILVCKSHWRFTCSQMTSCLVTVSADQICADSNSASFHHAALFPYPLTGQLEGYWHRISTLHFAYSVSGTHSRQTPSNSLCSWLPHLEPPWIWSTMQLVTDVWKPEFACLLICFHSLATSTPHGHWNVAFGRSWGTGEGQLAWTLIVFRMFFLMPQKKVRSGWKVIQPLCLLWNERFKPFRKCFISSSELCFPLWFSL